MKLGIIVILVPTLFCAMCTPAAGSHTTEEPQDRIHNMVDDAVRPVMMKNDIPGIAVGITVAGSNWVFNYGVASN